MLMASRPTFLVLDFGLDVVNGIGSLHLKGDGLAGESLDEDLHVGQETVVKDFLWPGFSNFYSTRDII